jgi:hypothetical protein
LNNKKKESGGLSWEAEVGVRIFISSGVLLGNKQANQSLHIMLHKRLSLGINKQFTLG